jgi:hypothetical protein
MGASRPEVFDEMEVPFPEIMDVSGIMPFSPLKNNIRFGEIYLLYHKGLRMSQAINQLSFLPASCWFLAWLIFRH